MDLVRNSQARLAARIILIQERAKDSRKDRGEGPVSYMAVILLIALVAAAIVSLDIDGFIANGIKNAVNKVWDNGTTEGAS